MKELFVFTLFLIWRSGLQTGRAILVDTLVISPRLDGVSRQPGRLSAPGESAMLSPSSFPLPAIPRFARACEGTLRACLSAVRKALSLFWVLVPRGFISCLGYSPLVRRPARRAHSYRYAYHLPTEARCFECYLSRLIWPLARPPRGAAKLRSPIGSR